MVIDILKAATLAEKRANLWREFKANYEAKMDEGFEEFSKYCDEFRARYEAIK